MQLLIEDVFGTEGSSERAKSGGVSRMLGVLDFSGKTLGSLDTCHHPDVGQILTTTVFFCIAVCHRLSCRYISV